MEHCNCTNRILFHGTTVQDYTSDNSVPTKKQNHLDTLCFWFLLSFPFIQASLYTLLEYVMEKTNSTNYWRWRSSLLWLCPAFTVSFICWISPMAKTWIFSHIINIILPILLLKLMNLLPLISLEILASPSKVGLSFYLHRTYSIVSQGIINFSKHQEGEFYNLQFSKESMHAIHKILGKF